MLSKEHQKIFLALERAKCIEDALVYLRTLNFHFLDSDPFFDHLEEQGVIQRIANVRFKDQFMVREIKRKTYDFRFVVTVRIWGDKQNKMYIYYIDPISDQLIFLKKLNKEWKDAADINFRKMVKRWVFPDALTYDERRDLRSEHKKVINPRSTYKGSDWYHQWWPLVQFIENADEL